MKVLFLDFDGVLNSRRYLRTADPFGVALDPTRMELLGQIVAATDARIVLTTSWRVHWEPDPAACNAILRTIDRVRRAIGIKNSPSAGDIASLERLFMQAMENRAGAREGDVEYAIAPKNMALLDFYDSVMSMSDKNSRSKRKLKLGDVSANQAEIIRNIFKTELGIDIDLNGYELWIDGDGIDHINRRHGKDGKANDSLSDRSDIAKIPWVANNAQFGELLRDQHGIPKRDAVYENSDQSKAYQVRVGMKIGENLFYVTECVPDSKNKRVYVKSAYKKRDKGQLLNLNPDGFRQPTSETLVDGDVSNNRVTEKPPVVNTQSMQNGKNYSKGAYLPPERMTGDALLDPSEERGNEGTRDGKPVPYDEAFDEAPVDEAAVMEEALRSQVQGRAKSQVQIQKKDVGAALDELARELGEEELLRRMYNAAQINRPTGTVEIDGQRVDANAYIDAYEQALPEDPAALEKIIQRLEQEREEAPSGVGDATSRSHKKEPKGPSAFSVLLAYGIYRFKKSLR